MKRLLEVLRSALIALTVALVGCGGGGGGTVPAVSFPAPTEFREMVAGYWAGELAYIAEGADHANLWWARDDKIIAATPELWHAAMAEQIQAALANGYTDLALHLPSGDPGYLRPQLAALSNGGHFNRWRSITLYWLDEPDTPAGGNRNDQQVADLITPIKQLALDTPGLAFAHFGVVYQCASGKHPGIKVFDRVGCYRYEATGCALIESDNARLRANLAPGARLWLVIGGADIGNVGHQDPACWEAYAQRWSDVWAYIFFMRQSGHDPNIRIVGIRENGMHTRYCEVGRRALRPKETPKC